ncbi:MAG: DUF421 domain-containing protein [Ilumatobacteraceae bacterium]|nr:DUF421 domain-containing protein [Ilumatobacteraceae bacterium]
MIENWLSTSWTEVWLVTVSAVAIVLTLVAVIRVVGLRALSKMSSFDFAVTIALGSVLGGVAASSTSLLNGMIAVGVLLATQTAIALVRQHTSVGKAVDNTPMLLMRDGEFIDEALRHTRVTRSDVAAKLREANAIRLDQVRAVVLESTGDVTVLHGDGPIDDLLLDGVRGAERAPAN